MKKVLILTEGGRGIGYGHITRCVSLYQALKQLHIEPKFIVKGEKIDLSFLKGINVNHFDWIKNRRKIFHEIEKSKIIIIDSYLANMSHYNEISSKALYSVFFDDYNRLKYPKGVVINGALYAKKINYEKKCNKIYLLGPKFACIRKKFLSAPQKRIRKKIKSILITFGGCDFYNLTICIVEFLNRAFPFIEKNVIIGKDFKQAKKIKKYYNKNKKIIYCPNSATMKKIMMESDIAISAGGQTLFELAKIGVPTIGICIAKNQMLNLKSWQSHGFLSLVGTYNSKLICSKIKNAINRMLSYKQRLKQSKAGNRNIDGKGALRIAKFLINYCK